MPNRGAWVLACRTRTMGSLASRQLYGLGHALDPRFTHSSLRTVHRRRTLLKTLATVHCSTAVQRYSWLRTCASPGCNVPIVCTMWRRMARTAQHAHAPSAPPRARRAPSAAAGAGCVRAAAILLLHLATGVPPWNVPPPKPAHQRCQRERGWGRDKPVC
eukprot:COSAG01_NODE_14270_length_1474_cov_1.731636_3_plen_160_part_00